MTDTAENLPRIAIGADHAGFNAKERVKAFLLKQNRDVTDFGTYNEESVDYPEIARPLAEAVAREEFVYGILLCGTGLGMSYTANKVSGIRAAVCWSADVAKMARLHNDANILVMPGRHATLDSLEAITAAWIETEFSGEQRHSRRIRLIEECGGLIEAVAIDGPAGAGKSTIARAVAEALGFLYVDTGAMYRAVALQARRAGVVLVDPEVMEHVAQTCRIDFDETGARVFLNNEDVSGSIRSPEITEITRFAARAPGVRAHLVRQQQQIARRRAVVMEGRDIATVVLPHARWKFFVTASPEVRARRRVADFEAQGHETDFDKVLTEIHERDDSDFKVGPMAAALHQAEKGLIHLVDTSDMTPAAVIDEIVAVIRAEREKD